MTIDKDKCGKILREKGIKVTRQRVLVLGILSACPEKHFTAEEIYDLVKAECPEIGLATVYRTIQILVELHLVDKLNLDDGFARYEIGKESGGESKHQKHRPSPGCRLQSELGRCFWGLLRVAASLPFVTAIVARV